MMESIVDHKIDKNDEIESLNEMAVSELAERPELVRRLLKEHEDSYHKTNTLTLRPLSRGLKATIWFLRLYVLFMIVVAVIQVVNTMHGS